MLCKVPTLLESNVLRYFVVTFPLAAAPRPPTKRQLPPFPVITDVGLLPPLIKLLLLLGRVGEDSAEESGSLARARRRAVWRNKCG